MSKVVFDLAIGIVNVFDPTRQKIVGYHVTDMNLDDWAKVIDVNCEDKGWNTPTVEEVLNECLQDGMLKVSFQELRTKLEQCRTQHEWAALAHTEISEAYEEYRNGNEPGEIYFNTPNGSISIGNATVGQQSLKPEGMAIEYADALIRILHWFARHKISATKAVALKMQYNTTRPFRHGDKKC